MRLWDIYHPEMPDLLRSLADTPEMRRLEQVGMNCGCEYTAFPRFRDLGSYSRFDHSVGAGLIVWHFTADPAQAAAALLHDIATPVFAHVVDFLRGDHLTQEATEAGTEAVIRSSASICTLLVKAGIPVGAVTDYSRYPIADNPTPRLSADRLEYTLGNLLNFGFCEKDDVSRFYGDIAVGISEDGFPELVFRHRDTAEEFALLAMKCAEIYVSPVDRYSMQTLAELLKDALADGLISEADLNATEPEIIARLESDDLFRERWSGYRAMEQVRLSPRPGDEPLWRQVRAKNRYIDPLSEGTGRVSQYSETFRQAVELFLSDPQEMWILGL